MTEILPYIDNLDKKGYVKICGFFSPEECDFIYKKHETSLINTLNPLIPGNENDGKNFKLGNEFYGKKENCWEIFKINLEEKDVVKFVDRLTIFNLGVYKSSQLVIRKKFIDNVLPCHVDNLFNKDVTYYNCGIYLNDTCENDKVYFVEGSHTIATTEYTFDEAKINKTYISAKKGDLIIHNSYTWHGSDNSDKEGRTTLYIKFQK